MIQLTLFEAAYDKRIHHGNTGQAQWNEIVEVLSEHEISDDKHAVRLFNGCEFHTPYQIRDNVKLIYLIILDFDGTLSMMNVKILLNQFEHCGYTSFSHKTEKKDGKDCFRVVLPLDHPVTADEFSNKRQAMISWIACDPASFDISRAFYLPSCSAETSDLAKVWINSGKRISIDMFEDNPVIVFDAKAESDLTDEQRAHWVEKLSRRYVGYEPTWASCAWVMASIGFSEHDFMTVSRGMMDSKDDKDIKAKWKSAVQRANHRPASGIGMLVNILRGKHDR